MTLQLIAHRYWTVNAVVLVLALLIVPGRSPARAQEGLESRDKIVVSPVETYVIPVNGPNTTGEVPQLNPALAQSLDGDLEVVRPTEIYLVPVDGPNLSGEIPPLDKSKAIPLHSQLQEFVSGQWYDHYAYYPLDGTEVQQYTNFKETEIGQYIAFQWWRNNNGGPNRFVYDGYTGSTHNWFNTWLNSSPSLSPGAEYTEGYGTRLQTYFKTNSSSCPCWLSDYRVGDH